MIVLALSCAVAFARTPVIKDWSSEGGNPQNKADARDLIYTVKPADKITFRAATADDCEHAWTAANGTKVLLALKKEGTKKSEFTFKVPDEKASWCITLEVCGEKMPVGATATSTKTWTLTTSRIKMVKPGESIQGALDAMPPEGGVVELADGKWNITSPIFIKKSNITLRGQGIDKTIINQTTSQADGVVISTFDDYKARDNWLYQNLIKWEAMLKWFDAHPRELVQNTTVADLNIYIFGGGKARHSGIGAVEVKNLLVSNVKIVGDADVKPSNAPRGVFISHFANVTVRNSIIDKAGEPLTYHGGSYWGNVIGCSISGGLQWTTIQYNGVSGRDGVPAIVRGNRIFNTCGSLDIYSSRDVLVTENTVENTKGQSGAIYINLPTGTVTVTKNIVRNVAYTSPHSGGIVLLQKYRNAKFPPNNITGNLIYNAKPHGIAFYHILQNLIVKDSVVSNTIFNSGKDGIHNPQGQPLTSVRNNIIAGSGGYGITGNAKSTFITAEYNNIYNNKSGHYNNCTGKNDIHVVPLFADPSGGNFHLKSKAGRWNPKLKKWVKDKVTSPCIDAGDPKVDCSKEPAPNGKRINMGAYGNTPHASKSAKP